MTKKNLKPVIVLTIICIAVGALLAGVNAITAPIIREKNEKAIAESLGKVMPEGQFNTDPDKLSENAPETIEKVYTEKTGRGTVVVLVTNKGYTGKNIGMTLGIDTEGKITGMVITQNEESIVPKDLKPGGTYGEAYIGKGADEIADLKTGATVAFTESAIKGAINDAFVYLGFAEEKPELPREESEIASLAREFYGKEGAKLKSSTPDPEEYGFVKRVYREDGKSEYVVYAFVYGSYGPPEFEFLIKVDANGAIQAIKKIAWKVSDPKPEWYYFPPSDEEVDAFLATFVGKTASDVLSVDIATGVTNTCGRVREAMNESLCFTDAPPKANYAPRIIGISIISVSVALAVAYAVVSKKRRGAK